MSNSSKRGAICYEVEASYGVDATTFATLRLQLVGMVDASGLKQNKIDTDLVTQYRQEGSAPALGTFNGSSFKTKFWLPGHGSATTGTPTANKLETLLGYVFGNVTVTGTGTTFTGTGTAAAPGTTSANGLVAGGLIRGGVLGDGRGNGQFAVVGSHAANVATLLSAFDAVPAAADPLYSAVNVYPSETPTASTIQSLRFLLQTANLCYECHGCVATAVQIGGLKAGDVPFIEVTWSCAWWRYSTAAFPSSVATETSQPAPNAAGSLVLNDVGSNVRQKLTYRDLTIDYTLGVELLSGPGGVNAYQDIVGAVRTPDQIKVSVVVDAPAQSANPTLHALAIGTTPQHMLVTLNPTPQKAMGIYGSNLCVKTVPTQFADGNINRLRLELEGYTGPTVASELQASAFRMAFS